jgi:hypothetical protein
MPWTSTAMVGESEVRRGHAMRWEHSVAIVSEKSARHAVGMESAECESRGGVRAVVG